MIPVLSPAAARILTIHDRLQTLGPLVGRQSLCRMYDIDLHDLDLLDCITQEKALTAPPRKEL